MAAALPCLLWRNQPITRPSLLASCPSSVDLPILATAQASPAFLADLLLRKKGRIEKYVLLFMIGKLVEKVEKASKLVLVNG